MNTNLYDFKYFLEVAQTKNISRASERIGITQPTLTQAIQRLEHSIGTKLLIRSKKGVELTAAGHKFHSQIQTLIASWDNIKRTTQESQTTVTGVLRLGCHVSVALYSLHHFLPKIYKKYSGVDIVLEHDLSRKIVDSIIHYRLDLGIVVNPTKHPDLVITKLCTDTVGIWSAPNAEPVLIYDPQLIQSQTILRKLRQKKSAQAYRTIETSSLEVATSLAMRGVGTAILPARVVQEHAPQKLKLMKDMPTFTDEICVVYRQENKGLKLIEAFINEIKKIF
jgi:LysR family transcriptional regulator, cell division regulator